MTIGQTEKKRISNNILDFFVHNKPTEFYPNTLPPIPYPLYIFFKDLRIYIPNIYIYTLRDKSPFSISYCSVISKSVFILIFFHFQVHRRIDSVEESRNKRINHLPEKLATNNKVFNNYIKRFV